ncbi:MAG: 50S ribosomal protein L25 [Acidobacteriota bacterium]|nr:50S ribosomal protein L25 [Acidobacteriota bacterium]
MRTDTVVTAEIRDTRGKNEARRTRVRGMIPGVVYGAFKDPVAIAVNPKFIQQILRSKTGHNTIFNVNITGVESTPVMVVDEQYDPVKSNLLHVDLKRIDLTKRIRVAVPVLTTGEAKGIKLQGGLLEIITRSVEIECIPDEIPQSFSVDVSELMIGQNIRASEIPMPGSAKLLSAGEMVIAHVVGQRAEEAVAEPVAVAEPEVAKAKGKKEDEAPPPVADKGKKK